MSSSDEGDPVASDSESQHSAQADPFLGSNSSSSNSLHSDHKLNLSINSSVRSVSLQPAQKPVAADVDMDNGDGDSDDEDESEHDAEREDEQVPDRSNKYLGPASTWRSWTEQERMLASSLDQIRAADLSIHLYNTHAMKRRLRTKEQQDRVPVWGNKERWVGTRDSSEELRGSETGVSVFVPPKVWTAWPMPPDEVPREGEKKLGRWEDEDEMWTLRRRGTGMASEGLQELLIAEVLKTAKDIFHKREWEDDEDEAGGAIRNNETSTKRRRRSTSTTKDDDNVSGSDKHRYTKPAVMADDEQARQILQPTIRHILTKLDDLLVGLHHARQAYLPTGDSTASETQTDMEETSPVPRKQKVKPKRGSLRTSKQHEEASSNNKPSFDSDSDSNFSVSFTKSPSPPRPHLRKRRRTPLSPASAALSRQKRQTRLGLRDWSDVLGVASMVGWDSAVVERAAERCAGLFGEGISFRTLEQGGREDTEVEYGLVGASTVERQGTENERDATENKTFKESKRHVGRAKDGLYYCPLMDCKRSRKSFLRSWNLNKHIREMHKDVEFPSGNVQDEEEVVGDVHVDGFLKPIQARRGWRSKDTEKRKRKPKPSVT